MDQSVWNDLLSLQTRHSEVTAQATAIAERPVKMDWTNDSEMKRHTATPPSAN